MPTQNEVSIIVPISILILLVAAICSGLNIGLLGIEPLRLETLEKCGEKSEQKAAKKVKKIMSDRHLLLCSILFFNALCMEVLPILLDMLVGPTLAIMISITGLLLCGEIIPQAVCNKYGLQIGATMVPILWAMIFLTFAATYPLARLLDKMLGAQKAQYMERKELQQLVMLHADEETHQSAQEDTLLDSDEALQIQGAIKASSMTVKEVMKDISQVFMLPINTVFDQETVDKIYNKGHSRVPIYDGNKNNIIGVVHVKQLILYKPCDKKQLNTQSIRQNLLFLEPTTRIFDALNQFQTGKSHLGIVRDEEKVFGIVTCEDIVELILQSQIFDEFDYKQNQK